MCGINGIVNLKSVGNFGNEVRRMNDALAHRGPDDEGIYEENGIALGHRRLSIIDLSLGGHQPMHYENGQYTIVYNGELYNYRELKAELSELNFKTENDTEVILASFAKWGTACLDKFNGMFAFAIWDKIRKKLFVVRDRLGIKPLYYSFVDGNFIFSSEVRGILASEKVKRKLNKNAIADYLRYQTVHAPETIVENVKMLMPGNYLILKKEQIEIECWWKPSLFQQNFEDEAKKRFKYDLSHENRCKEIRNLLRNAVECRLIADVPFGAFLSGGIDSSAIVGLMSEVSTTKVKTFSVVFDDSEFSESVYSRIVADKFKTEHHEIKLTPNDFLADVSNALDAMDHPSGDGPNTYVVSKATKAAGITMALSGLGGDELFCGYEVFKRAMEIEKKKWLNIFPRGVRKMGGGIVKRTKGGMAGEKMAAMLGQKKINFSNYYPLSRQILLEEQIAQLIPKELISSSTVFSFVQKDKAHFPKENFVLSRTSSAEISTYMQNVLLRDTDQMSMAHALEVRVPFLDYRLVEYVMNLSDDLKYPVTPKKLLVDSLSDLLPDVIVDRPKMGFTFPWKNWMKNELKSFCEERLKKLGKRNVFDEKGIQNLWNSFLEDDPLVTWSRVWPFVVLSHWLEKNGIED